MELLCIQSQEHPQLPIAELKAVMECENIDAEVEIVTEGLVILKNISEVQLRVSYFSVFKSVLFSSQTLFFGLVPSGHLSQHIFLFSY